MELSLLKNNHNTKLLIDSSKKYYIAKTTDKINNNVIERDHFRIFTNANNNEDDSTYEVLEFLDNNNPSLVYSLFHYISNINKTISNAVFEIEDFLSNNIIDITLVRGVFAELWALTQYNDLKINHTNAIYDFEEEGVDVEIKSISGSKSTIKVSKQQALNSKNAKILCFEILESNDGISTRELFLKMNISNSRFNWIHYNNSNLLDIKFISKNTYVKKMNELFVGLQLPKSVINAYFDVLIK